MILLLAGTSDAIEIARRLLRQNLRVLVSNATDVSQKLPAMPGLEFRSGALDEDSLCELITEKKIEAIVDATHPYASKISELAYDVTRKLKLAFFVYDRPGIAAANLSGVIKLVENHKRAAELVKQITTQKSHRDTGVLLTVGSRNLHTYVDALAGCDAKIFPRVLPADFSFQACNEAGVSSQQVIAIRGPFSVEQNIEHLKFADAKIMVTKDSGQAGGLPEKIRACEITGTTLVVVVRPARPGDAIFHDYDKLVEAVLQKLSD